MTHSAISSETYFFQNMVRWFQAYGRDLPWRHDPTPYQVWVSELMLQQTQVVTVIPYYMRWMALFPDIFALAGAPLEQVLSVWAGLGYYRRARFLHEGARRIVSDYHGEFPSSIAELRKIPGIGAYTAGAIASFAYHQNEPAIDGNAERVLSRFFGIAGDLSRGDSRKILENTAHRLAAFGHSRDLNQAIMDLGASICSKVARCEQCPVADRCYALTQGLTQSLPQKKTPVVKMYELRACIKLSSPEGKILLAKRKSDELLGNLWEFPMVSLFKGTVEAKTELDPIKRRPRRQLWNQWLSLMEIGLSHWQSVPGEVRHTFTHIQMTVLPDIGDVDKAFDLSTFLCDGYDAFAWVSPTDLTHYPMSTLMKKIIHSLGD